MRRDDAYARQSRQTAHQPYGLQAEGTCPAISRRRARTKPDHQADLYRAAFQQ